MGFFDLLKRRSPKGSQNHKSSNSIDKYSNIRTLHIESMMYYQKARELYEDNEEFFPTLQEALRYQLLNHQRNGFDRVKILAAESPSCKVCQKMDDNVLTITTALKNMPIPRKDCKHTPNKNGEGWCRCTYVPYDNDLESKRDNMKVYAKIIVLLLIFVSLAAIGCTDIAAMIQ